MSIYPDLISSTVQMILALLIVLAGLLATFYFIRRFITNRAGGGQRLIRVAASAAVGFKKYVSLVEVAGEYLVLGISDHNICLLSKLEDPEAIAQLSKGQPQKSASGFAAHLQMFSSRFKELHNGK